MVALVSEHAPRQFYFFHDVVLQASMAILVATMWVVFLWTRRTLGTRLAIGVGALGRCSHRPDQRNRSFAIARPCR